MPSLVRACGMLVAALLLAASLIFAQTTGKQGALRGKPAIVTQPTVAQTYAWAPQAPMGAAREQAAAAVLDDKLYVTGGQNLSQLNTVEIYDPAVGHWAAAPSLPAIRTGHSAAVLDGKLYIMGGFRGGNGITNSVEVYDPTTHFWTPVASLNVARAALAAAVVDGKLYALGGLDNSAHALNVVEVYDLATNTWSFAPPMPTARGSLAATAVGGKLYAIGGDSTPFYRDTVEVFDPVANSWSTAAPMISVRSGPAAAVLNNKIYALGGFDRDTVSPTMEVYDPATNIWSPAPAPPTARIGHVAAALNNSLYVAGGYNRSVSADVNTMDAFTPLTNPSDVLISEFRFHGATGATDEFIELANTSNTAFTVNSADGSAGWALVAAGGTVLTQIPNGTIIPAHGHLLVVNSAGYSLAGYPAGNATTATPDFSYTQDIPDNSGVALFATQNATNFNASARLDAAGYTLVTDPLYREGGGIAGFPESNGEYSQLRKLNSGRPQDTNDNDADFVFIATQGDTIYGLDSNFSILGAPGPENLSSPVEHNADVKSSLLDSCSGAAPCQNRVRNPAPDPTQSACSPLGTLSLRRRFKNTTQQPVTRLRFRVVDITTLGNRTPSEADVRALSSTQTAVVLSTGTPATVEGTTLEQPPAQAQCGGLNSSLSAGTITLAQPLAPGASINVQFLLGVVQGGSFRFFVNVAALPAPSGFTNRPASKTALKWRP